jgi:hypothetical protein
MACLPGSEVFVKPWPISPLLAAHGGQAWSEGGSKSRGWEGPLPAAVAATLPRKRERGGASSPSRDMDESGRGPRAATQPQPCPIPEPVGRAVKRRGVPPLSRLRGRDSAKAPRQGGAEQGGGPPITLTTNALGAVQAP